MTTPTTITLPPYERIVAVVPQHCSGPGWANSLAVVYIVGDDGRLRTVYLQPNEQSDALLTLFNIGAAVCDELVRAVPIKKVKE